MRDVAAEAKVSVMTVSRVLHNESLVADATRDRVLAAVEKLNFRRNEAARNLRLGREAGLIGLVVANIANPYYSELTLGVEAVMSAHDRRLIIANSAGSVEREEDLVSDFTSRRVEGLIVTPSGREQSFLHRLVREKLPLVLAGSPPVGVDADCVLVDDFVGALDSTRRLIELGSRRIGFLGNPPSLYTDAERFRGYSAALEEAGFEPTDRHVRRFTSDVKGYQQAAADMLNDPQPPTAIFAANNRIALGVLRAVVAKGADVLVACFDRIEVADLIGVPLIMVTFDADLLGRRSAELLMDQINRPDDTTRRRLVIPTVLSERNISAT
jgi:LacI family transcriptional regulator